MKFVVTLQLKLLCQSMINKNIKGESSSFQMCFQIDLECKMDKTLCIFQKQTDMRNLVFLCPRFHEMFLKNEKLHEQETEM